MILSDFFVIPLLRQSSSRFNKLFFYKSLTIPKIFRCFVTPIRTPSSFIHTRVSLLAIVRIKLNIQKKRWCEIKIDMVKWSLVIIILFKIGDFSIVWICFRGIEQQLQFRQWQNVRYGIENAILISVSRVSIAPCTAWTSKTTFRYHKESAILQWITINAFTRVATFTTGIVTT